MTAVAKVQFQAKWKEELIGTLDGKQFVIELTMGVLGAYFPTQTKWEESAPEWAKPEWKRVRADLEEWCGQQKIPLEIRDDAWVNFGH